MNYCTNCPSHGYYRELNDTYLRCYQENERLHSLIDKILVYVRNKTPAFYNADESLKEAKTIREFETKLADIRKKASKEEESHDQ